MCVAIPISDLCRDCWKCRLPTWNFWLWTWIAYEPKSKCLWALNDFYLFFFPFFGSCNNRDYWENRFVFLKWNSHSNKQIMCIKFSCLQIYQLISNVQLRWNDKYIKFKSTNSDSFCTYLFSCSFFSALEVDKSWYFLYFFATDFIEMSLTLEKNAAGKKYEKCTLAVMRAVNDIWEIRKFLPR